MDFGKLQWLFPVAITLHNAEEAIWMPSWDMRHAPELPVHPPGVFQIRLVLVALSVAAFVVNLLSASRTAEQLGLSDIRFHRCHVNECFCSPRAGGDSISRLRARCASGARNESQLLLSIGTSGTRTAPGFTFPILVEPVN